MHLFMILTALTLAQLVRVRWRANVADSWTGRWQRSLCFFLFSPLLLSATGLAVLCMGPQGSMLGLPVGWFSYLLVLVLFVGAIALLLQLAWQGWLAIQQTRTYPLQNLEVFSLPKSLEFGRLLETPALFSALVGFWQPELVVSQGLLHALTSEQLAAVFAHEQAHFYYRDTFWFFWLGWVRSCTAWLPNTEALWQELLLLRELRADRRAAQQVDPLILAESLLLVVQSSIVPITTFCAAFSAVREKNRLTQRLEALLAESEDDVQPQVKWSWLWLLLTLLPLVTVPFHS